MTFTFNLAIWFLHTAHHLMMVNIYVKLFFISATDEGVMDRASCFHSLLVSHRMTLTFNIAKWFLCTVPYGNARAFQVLSQSILRWQNYALDKPTAHPQWVIQYVQTMMGIKMFLHASFIQFKQLVNNWII